MRFWHEQNFRCALNFSNFPETTEASIFLRWGGTFVSWTGERSWTLNTPQDGGRSYHQKRPCYYGPVRFLWLSCSGSTLRLVAGSMLPYFSPLAVARVFFLTFFCRWDFPWIFAMSRPHVLFCSCFLMFTAQSFKQDLMLKKCLNIRKGKQNDTNTTQAQQTRKEW